MTSEEIKAFEVEQKQFTEKKKRIDMGKKIQTKLKYIQTANEFIDKKDGVYEVKYWIGKLMDDIEKDSILSKNIKLFLTVLKEDYEKDFKNL